MIEKTIIDFGKPTTFKQLAKLTAGFFEKKYVTDGYYLINEDSFFPNTIQQQLSPESNDFFRIMSLNQIITQNAQNSFYDENVGSYQLDVTSGIAPKYVIDKLRKYLEEPVGSTVLIINAPILERANLCGPIVRVYYDEGIADTRSQSFYPETIQELTQSSNFKEILKDIKSRGDIHNFIIADKNIHASTSLFQRIAEVLLQTK